MSHENGPVDETSIAPHGQPPGVPLSHAVSDPGLPEHHLRRTDRDPKAERRAERQVAGLFGLAVLAAIGFVVGFIVIPRDSVVYVVLLGNVRTVHLVLGATTGIALLAIGLAALHWAKQLMTDEELIQERHPLRSSDEERQAAAQRLLAGGEQSGLGRRSLIRRSMIAAFGALLAPPLVLLKELGPTPKKELEHTVWRKHTYLVTDPTNRRIRADQLQLGSVVHVLPEVKKGEHLPLDERGKAAVILIRLSPTDIKEQQGEGWDYEGIVAYSKVCTHVGCPVGLYEQTTHHLLCPCHQSTFDVTRGCKVVFGPAGRPLPQLAITVDAEGYLMAKQGFAQPVGPSYWERS